MLQIVSSTNHTSSFIIHNTQHINLRSIHTEYKTESFSSAVFTECLHNTKIYTSARTPVLFKPYNGLDWNCGGSSRIERIPECVPSCSGFPSRIWRVVVGDRRAFYSDGTGVFASQFPLRTLIHSPTVSTFWQPMSALGRECASAASAWHYL